MADLSVFGDESFDLIFHPVANCFVPDLGPVWREAFRVLRPGGALLSGMMNPVYYCFDFEKAEKGELEVRHSLPYADLTSLDPDDPRKILAGGSAPGVQPHPDRPDRRPAGGRFPADRFLRGRFRAGHRPTPVSKFMPTMMATRAFKPRGT